MKNCIRWLLCLTLTFIVFGCAILPQEGLEPPVAADPAPAALQRSALLQMDELLIIQRTTDYLRAQGETPVFSETYMRLHDRLETPVLIRLQNGFLQVSEDYLEVRLYGNPDGEHASREACYVLYLAEDGSILGYRKEAGN